jgi:hypothetical protein
MIEELHGDLSVEVESVRVVSEQEFSKPSHCGKALWRSAANWQPSPGVGEQAPHKNQHEVPAQPRQDQAGGRQGQTRHLRQRAW